ncbi:MAG: ATP-binding protein [Marinifilaceae bacterium]|jgi:signal transduction histidine kinase|nr:ATP-binding protein [Marinifilaceae bacterium]
MTKSNQQPGNRYRKRLFIIYFLIVFLFTFSIGLVQFRQERIQKREKLEYALDIYTEQVHNIIKKNELLEKNNFSIIDSLISVFPDSGLRISIIDKNGKVKYDSYMKDEYFLMDNHLSRLELQKALHDKKGSNIRFSNSTKLTYYYYAKFYYTCYVRAALPFNQSLSDFLKANYVFFYILGAMFIIVLILLVYVSGHFGNSISKLRKFAVDAGHNRIIDKSESFGKDELGEIGKQIVNIYDKLSNTTEDLKLEKAKLIKHLKYVDQGVAIFDKDRNLILWNSHFVNYINYLTSVTKYNYSEIFKIKELKSLVDFVDYYDNEESIKRKETLTKKQEVYVAGKILLFQVIIFNDQDFEISILDITHQVNERKMKQEMTLNIAHELKTPVTAISGYLETILEDPDMDKETRERFMKRSVSQIDRLTVLIKDISVLTKIEDASEMFKLSKVNLSRMLNNLVHDYQPKLESSKMKINLKIEEEIELQACIELLDSIFRNLIDNSIKYAGEGADIHIAKHFDDSNYIYFTYSDTGVGVKEEHLAKIFERFYRVDTSRSRSIGGTGLGLSIVKNSVSFHKGKIYAKSRKSGGVEFFFSLKKNLE